MAPLSHTIQFGTDGTELDYVGEGGQDLLFPYARLSADLDIKRQTVTLLYQPLQIDTTFVARRDMRFDGVDFPEGTSIDAGYGFSFWRGTWRHDLLADPDRELALGVGLQIRDANIVFTSADGELRSTSRDIGPVPLLAARARTPLGDHLWLGGEIEGFYAPVKYLNGANTDVVGAVADGSATLGIPLRAAGDVLVTARYIGGGAEGTDKSPDGLGDGFTSNWLHFGTLSVGAMLR